MVPSSSTDASATWMMRFRQAGARLARKRQRVPLSRVHRGGSTAGGVRQGLGFIARTTRWETYAKRHIMAAFSTSTSTGGFMWSYRAKCALKVR